MTVDHKRDAEPQKKTQVVANGEMIVYRRLDGRGSAVQLKTGGGTVWLPQRAIADLYGTTVPNINQIISRILAEGELTEATINSELIVRSEGTRTVQRTIAVYNLDMILAVGYRVTTPQAVMFRQWATTVLSEYLVKGFALDDERLKNPGQEPDYFDEVLDRIRAIRASELRFYQKVRDLFVVTSVDYDKDSPVAREFFATVQNKLLYAVTQQTAAELVTARCDPESLSFGLTNWPKAEVRKVDTLVAKNYLTEDELEDLDRLTVLFLEFADNRARRRLVTTMEQWVVATDELIVFAGYPVLRGPGHVSHEEAESLISREWVPFEEGRRTRQRERALEQEAIDISALLQLEGGGRHGDPA